jgi:hypothetical protein
MEAAVEHVPRSAMIAVRIVAADKRIECAGPSDPYRREPQISSGSTRSHPDRPPLIIELTEIQDLLLRGFAPSWQSRPMIFSSSWLRAFVAVQANDLLFFVASCLRGNPGQ